MNEFTAALRRAYDEDADRRDRVEPDAWRLAIVDDLAARVLGAGGGDRALELGCGTGQLAQRLGDTGLQVVAVDLSPAMVGRARARGVDALVADFTRLPFADASFDAALAFNSLLHVPQAELSAAFTEIRRVLAVGGLLTVVRWGGVNRQGPLPDDDLHPPRFYSTFTDADLLAQPIPGFTRLSTDVLHEHVNEGVHPQVELLVASELPSAST